VKFDLRVQETPRNFTVVEFDGGVFRVCFQGCGFRAEEFHPTLRSVLIPRTSRPWSLNFSLTPKLY
jgi:hypothetical protein